MDVRMQITSEGRLFIAFVEDRHVGSVLVRPMVGGTITVDASVPEQERPAVRRLLLCVAAQWRTEESLYWLECWRSAENVLIYA